MQYLLDIESVKAYLSGYLIRVSSPVIDVGTRFFSFVLKPCQNLLTATKAMHINPKNETIPET